MLSGWQGRVKGPGGVPGQAPSLGTSGLLPEGQHPRLAPGPAVPRSQLFPSVNLGGQGDCHGSMEQDGVTRPRGVPPSGRGDQRQAAFLA